MGAWVPQCQCSREPSSTLSVTQRNCFQFWQGWISAFMEVPENEGQWWVTGDLLFYLCGHYVVISAECIQIYTLSAIMCFWRIVYIHIDMFEQEMLEVSPDESQQSTFNPFEKFIKATEWFFPFPSLCSFCTLCMLDPVSDFLGEKNDGWFFLYTLNTIICQGGMCWPFKCFNETYSRATRYVNMSSFFNFL